MQRCFGLTAAVVALVGAAACSKPASPDKGLTRDLDLAGSSSLALAPTAGHTDVVSAVERTPEATPAVRPSTPERRVVRHHVPQATLAATAPAPAPVPIAVAPSPAVESAPVPAAVPAPVPTTVAPIPAPRPTPVQQSRRGGYKTEAEVFRDAPFPILP